MSEVTAIICTKCGMRFRYEPNHGRCSRCYPQPYERRDPGPTLVKSVDCACCTALIEKIERAEREIECRREEQRDTEKELELEREVNRRLLRLVREERQ